MLSRLHLRPLPLALIALTSFLWLPSASAETAEAFRGKRSLNGTWEAVTAQETADQPPGTGWEPRPVPNTQQSDARRGTFWTWYRRQLEIPKEWQGRRVFLTLGGARYNARVLLDGKLLGQRLEGWTPFELELPDVQAGRTYQLAVRCQDWSATFADGYSIPADYQGDARHVGNGSIVAPIGGHFTFYGIWDDVWLESRPQVYLDEVAIDSSFRQKQLTVTGRLAGWQAGLTVQAEVLDGDRVALTTPAAPIPKRAWSLSAPVSDVRWWSPEDPHLDRLRLTLRRGQKVVDVREERFGFRELWAEGPDFYLNGVKRHLLATSTWPSSSPQTREEVRANLAQIKAGNNVAFRLHTQPWQKQWIEEADEVGLMIVEEGALWCDGSGSYGYNNDLFWDNTQQHLSGMVRRDRNNPSLVLWSLENEILHCGAARYRKDTEAKLAELGRFVKQLDSTHLITYEADLDPDGAADVVGLHYPHELPANYAYPNTADWLSETVQTGVEGGLLGSRGQGFRWDRKKPLYIGEYLWVPYQDFSPGSVFFGDEAYEDRAEYHRRAQAEAWRYQTLAYRRAGVSGTCPWTAINSGGGVNRDLLFEAEKEVYEPVAAFLRNVDSRFFAGEAVKRTFDVFNDSTADKELVLAWSLTGTEIKGSESLKLAPAGHQAVEVTVPMPDTEAPRDLALQWTLSANGKTLHQGSQSVRIYPRQPLKTPADMQVAVFDPHQEWSGKAKADGLSSTPLTALADLAKADPLGTLLVIGPAAFEQAKQVEGLPRIGEETPGIAELIGFLNRGGRALVLEQTNYDGVPLGVSLVDHASTLTFLQAADHPVLKGFGKDDVKFWRGDNYVTQREFLRPTAGGVKPLLVSGGESSLAQSPLVEVPTGAGAALLLQTLTGAKLDTEPAARQLLQNALDYLADRGPRGPRTVALSDDPAFTARLKRLGVAFEATAGPLKEGDVKDASLVLLHGGGDALAGSGATLQAYLASSPSATVYWHAPEGETFARLGEQLGATGFQVLPSSGPITARGIGTSLLSGLCREDLTFGGLGRGDSWMRPFAPDPTVIDRALVPTASGGAATRIEAESMALEGRYVSVAADGGAVNFATVGTGTFAFETDKPGIRPVTVYASGTPAGGVLPLVALRRANQTLAQLSLTQRDPKDYHTMIDLPAGKSELSVAFVNDVQEHGEDRNLTLDALEIGREPLDASKLELLTLPPAVVAFPSGKGRVVIDCVRWDQNPKNETKGMRYASVLLANLGASFVAPQPEPAWVPASAFELQGDSAYFGKTADLLTFASHGVCQAEFDCVKPGAYEVVVRGYAKEADGVYGKAKVTVDGAVVGEVELASASTGVFAVGTLDSLTEGKHTVTVEFTNDIWQPPLDRNLYVSGVGFRSR